MSGSAPVFGPLDPHVAPGACDQASPSSDAVTRGKVTAIERLRNTRDGNPVWRITLDDERFHDTRANSQVGNVVGRFLIGGFVCLHLSAARKVVHCHRDRVA